MKRIAIVYWSATGNTEAMAKAVEEGAREEGAQTEIFTSDEFTADMVEDFERIAFGCPSMGVEVLEEEEFEPMFTSVETVLGGKEIAIFGSYGWGDGQWMREWHERCLEGGINVVNDEGLIINETPDAEGLEQCKELGRQLAK
ncbi:MAG: flavodoxin [Clostridiales bacterium]|nr:flavodoxin [Clostridiales bacterium]